MLYRYFSDIFEATLQKWIGPAPSIFENRQEPTFDVSQTFFAETLPIVGERTDPTSDAVSQPDFLDRSIRVEHYTQMQTLPRTVSELLSDINSSPFMSSDPRFPDITEDFCKPKKSEDLGATPQDSYGAM